MFDNEYGEFDELLKTMEEIIRTIKEDDNVLGKEFINGAVDSLLSAKESLLANNANNERISKTESLINELKLMNGGI